MKESKKEQLRKEYEALCEIFGINRRLWESMHCRFSSYIFCKENRTSFIAEYFLLKDFTERAKEAGVPYFVRIDDFLKAYKKAIESRVNIED